MAQPHDEDAQLRSVALQNANSILAARQRAEQELLAAKEELSLIYSNVSDVIFYVAAEPNGRYRFVSVNAAFLAATGLSHDQVVGKLVREVIPEPSRSLVLDNYAKAIRERRAVRDGPHA